MLRKSILAAAVTAVAVVSSYAFAADEAEIKKLREEIDTLKEGYETRLRQLEQSPEKTDQGAARSATPVQSAPASANAFNPAISLILGGQFSNLQRDPETYQIGGFIPGGDEIGPGNRSFNLGESELTVSANIDPWFSGFFVMAVTPENEVEVEEGYVQNTGSVPGVTVKFGRFLSAFGYLNEIHAHAWDFVDAPLALQAFFGGQLKQDGLQARWVAPTSLLIELGMELGLGDQFPGTDRDKNGFNSMMMFAHLGGDVGFSNSYLVGATVYRSKANDRTYQDLDQFGAPVTDAFTGDTEMWGLDFVWKWAPDGNSVEHNFKL